MSEMWSQHFERRQKAKFTRVPLILELGLREVDGHWEAVFLAEGGRPCPLDSGVGSNPVEAVAALLANTYSSTGFLDPHSWPDNFLKLIKEAGGL